MKNIMTHRNRANPLCLQSYNHVSSLFGSFPFIDDFSTKNLREQLRQL